MTAPSNPYADPLDEAFEPASPVAQPAAEPAYLRGLNAEQRDYAGIGDTVEATPMARPG